LAEKLCRKPVFLSWNNPSVPIVAFDGVTKSYGHTPALQGVSFDVPPGEIFGLLGPNGAGKSTLIRILMDIIRPDDGEVRVFGHPRTREDLDRLGYLPEERGLYTKLRVIDVMTYFGALKGLSRADARRRAFEWLDKVDLAHVASWKIERLSKGMSQKVQIAATLLSDPEVCVMDEPTTGLDPINVRLVQDLLIERRRSGRTTILSTHQMNQVEAFCDRVALIHRGRLMVYGTVDEVRRRYSRPEVRVDVHGPLPAIPETTSAVQASDGGWRITTGQGSEPSELLRVLVNAGAVIHRFEPLLAPMEDIFLSVVTEVPA
jgi:ABC-2 type transport system ATP-binding protein